MLGRTREVRGARAVAKQAFGFRRLAGGARRALVNGAAGLVVFAGERPFAVMGFTIRGGRIVAIDILADPERLDGLDLSVSYRARRDLVGGGSRALSDHLR